MLRLRRISTLFACTLVALAPAIAPGSASQRQFALTVPPCSRDIVLKASYLTAAAPGAGAGFLFRLENHTRHAITLAEPVPSSAHWYALTPQGKYLWRASSGRGGSVVDATRQRGPLFAYRPPAPEHPAYLTLEPGQAKEWIGSEQQNPALAYKPTCERCNYPGEREYRAIFAYAYVPYPGEQAPGLLNCGLRSEPVDMPPYAVVKK